MGAQKAAAEKLKKVQAKGEKSDKAAEANAAKMAAMQVKMNMMEQQQKTAAKSVKITLKSKNSKENAVKQAALSQAAAKASAKLAVTVPQQIQKSLSVTQAVQPIVMSQPDNGKETQAKEKAQKLQARADRMTEKASKAKAQHKARHAHVQKQKMHKAEENALNFQDRLMKWGKAHFKGGARRLGEMLGLKKADATPDHQLIDQALGANTRDGAADVASLEAEGSTVTGSRDGKV